MKEVQENFRTSFGPSALKAISADTEVLAKRIMTHEDRIANLETWRAKSVVAMPAPAWKPGNLAEPNQEAVTCIEASERNFKEGRISLAWFWLDQCAGALGRHPEFVAQWLGANAGQQTFRDWAVSQFAGREQFSP
jgi:hypothetical protein